MGVGYNYMRIQIIIVLLVLGSFFWFVFSPSPVQLYIAGLPLRSCLDPWATFCRGVPQCLIFVSGSGGIRTHVPMITMRTHYHYATLTPHYATLTPCEDIWLFKILFH